jgi:hypothetical protein
MSSMCYILAPHPSPPSRIEELGCNTYRVVLIVGTVYSSTYPSDHALCNVSAALVSPNLLQPYHPVSVLRNYGVHTE